MLPILIDIITLTFRFVYGFIMKPRIEMFYIEESFDQKIIFKEFAVSSVHACILIIMH